MNVLDLYLWYGGNMLERDIFGMNYGLFILRLLEFLLYAY